MWRHTNTHAPKHIETHIQSHTNTDKRTHAHPNIKGAVHQAAVPTRETGMATAVIDGNHHSCDQLSHYWAIRGLAFRPKGGGSLGRWLHTLQRELSFGRVLFVIPSLFRVASLFYSSFVEFLKMALRKPFLWGLRSLFTMRCPPQQDITTHTQAHLKTCVNVHIPK